MTHATGASEGARERRPWSRLGGRADIQRALAARPRQTKGRMVLYVLPRERRTRVAFVCGRRVGGAVVRNRARRRLREAWRSLAPGVQGGFDIVFVARPEIVDARTQDLIPEMAGALSAAGVLA